VTEVAAVLDPNYSTPPPNENAEQFARDAGLVHGAAPQPEETPLDTTGLPPANKNIAPFVNPPTGTASPAMNELLGGSFAFLQALDRNLSVFVDQHAWRIHDVWEQLTQINAKIPALPEGGYNIQHGAGDTFVIMDESDIDRLMGRFADRFSQLNRQAA
jgi:hypothetical protein